MAAQFLGRVCRVHFNAVGEPTEPSMAATEHAHRVEMKIWRNMMSKRDDLIAKYTQDLVEKCGVQPDAELLRKVVIGCGPSIYNADASTVSGSDPKELLTVQKNFLEKKLGLPDGPELQTAIDAVMEKYGRSNRSKYRAVVYYLLTVHFGREHIYK